LTKFSEIFNLLKKIGKNLVIKRIQNKKSGKVRKELYMSFESYITFCEISPKFDEKIELLK